MTSDEAQENEILSFMNSPGSMSSSLPDDRLARRRLEMYTPIAEVDNTLQILTVSAMPVYFGLLR